MSLQSIFLYKVNGDLFVWGNNQYGQLGLGDYLYRDKPVLLMNDLRIKKIIKSINFTMLYKTNGDLFVFGSNTFGNLGLGDFYHRDIPVLLMNDINIRK